METLRIQRLLRQGISLTKLKEELGILSKRSELYPELYLFKYDSIRADMSNSVVQECRGLILNKEASWATVCFPYTKFFNHNESLAAILDLDTTRIYPKLDGSLLNLYYFNDKWNVATSGNPDAVGPVHHNNDLITFNSLFWLIWKQLGYILPPNNFKDYTFMFELTSIFNRVVVQYKSSDLILHGIRHNITHNEIKLDRLGLNRHWDWCNWHKCVGTNFLNFDILFKQIENLDPLKQEGVILIDKDFNRVKVKSKAYVNLHHVKSNMCPKSMLEIIRNNESEEFLSQFPEYRLLHTTIKKQYSKLNILIGSYANEWKEKKIQLEKQGLELSRKEVGLYFKKYFFCGIIFRLIFDNEKLEQILRNMSIKKLEYWLKEIR